jgi:equilibrative nucleoside transporter 1/2/3
MAGAAPTHTGSEYGRHTFHIPNSFSRRPIADDFHDHGASSSQPGLYGASKAQREVALPGHSHENEEDIAAEAHEATAMLDYNERSSDPDHHVEWDQHSSLGAAGKVAVLATFSVLGAAVLLPFNTLITPTEYYRSIFASSHVATNFMSWVLLAFNVGTIVFGAHAVVSLHKTTPAQRIYFASASIFLGLLLYTFFTTRSSAEADGKVQDLYFALLILVTFGVAASTAYLQNAVVSLCSVFGGRAMGFMLTGQGVIGVAISVVQLVAAFGSTKLPPKGANGGADRPPPPPPGPAQPVGEEAASRAATIFFASSTLFVALSIASFLWLARSKVYRDTCRGYEVATQSSGVREASLDPRVQVKPAFLSSLVEKLPPAARANAHQILDVQSKVLLRATCILVNFAITLSVFPALTARVRSTASRDEQWATPLVFIALHFLILNSADLLGRMAPMVRGLLIRSEKLTVLGTVLRIVFIPLFFACNIHLEGQSPKGPLPDWAFFTILFFFGLSNGLVSTSIFIVGPASSKLSSDSERAMAGAVLSFWLTLGLAVGSIGSFAITAMI